MEIDTKHEILARLRPVCRRQRKRAVFAAVGRGLLYGSTIAIAAGLVNLAFSTWPVGFTGLPDAVVTLVRGALLPGLAVAALLVGPLTGAWLALRRELDWHAAAAAVDRYYRLHDRTVTALAFLEKTQRKPLEEMQLADCTERLMQIDPRAVVRVGLPKPLLAALALALLAVAATAGPLAVRPQTGPHVEPKAEPRVNTEPPDQKPPFDAARAAQLAAKIKWQVAPSGEVAAIRSSRLPGATLQEVVSAAERRAAEGRTHGSELTAEPGRIGSAKIVLEGEPLPLKHRRTIRRYFESIRPER